MSRIDHSRKSLPRFTIRSRQFNSRTTLLWGKDNMLLGIRFRFSSGWPHWRHSTAPNPVLPRKV